VATTNAIVIISQAASSRLRAVRQDLPDQRKLPPMLSCGFSGGYSLLRCVRGASAAENDMRDLSKWRSNAM
jgi:hypothetical protein